LTAEEDKTLISIRSPQPCLQGRAYGELWQLTKPSAKNFVWQ